ncbi:MAG: glycogen synthase [Clostridia bacterium]|nr:glycogen synthase [Clostridia bacterium]
MNILYATTEASPFVASGGLADVMGALPKSIASLGEHSVSVIMPLYKKISDTYREKMEHYIDVPFKLSWRDTGTSVYRLTDAGVTYYFLENHYYFDRDKLYGEYDDAERFAFFSAAVVEFILASGNAPDILNANDWQTALIPVYLKTKYRGIEALSGIKTVFTIHNIEYQGKFDPFVLGDVFGLDNEWAGLLEYDGCVNLMKAALLSADYITTVSPNYAYELRHDFFAFGLAGIVGSVSHKLSGVINGIDYGYFSPSHGGDIDFPYNKRNAASGKAKNKEALCAELGLSTDTSLPLVAMITRLASQKGIDLLLHIADELLSEKMQLVILGTGEPEYESALLELEARHPNLRVLLRFDRVISKRIYASADIFLMPSKSEPCGLAQMICCSYGTIPVVRSVGGLCDSIIPYGAPGANGFRFDNYNAHELLYAATEALKLYRNKDKWRALRTSAMNSDFTWKKSAEKYLAIYDNLLKW